MIDWNETFRLYVNGKNDIYRQKSNIKLVIRDILRITNTAEKSGYNTSDNIVEEACQKILTLHGWIMSDYFDALENYTKNESKNSDSVMKN